MDSSDLQKKNQTIMNDRAERLGKDSIPKLLIRFSVPAIIGMLAQALYNITDRVFIGMAIGTNGIAAATISFPFMMLTLACGMLIGFGGTSLISIRLGEERQDRAEHILGNMLVMLILLSTTVTFIGLYFLDPMLVAFGAGTEVLPLARDYLQVILFGVVLQMVGFGMNAAIRGEGNPRIAMFSMLISVIINAILTPLFIFGFSWGIRGAAWATIIGQGVSAVWIMSYFLGGYSLLKLKWADLVPDFRVSGQVLAVGLPPFLMQVLASLLQSMFNHQLRIHGGDTAIAAMGIIYSTLMMFLMPIFGLNHGVQPIIGYNYGARNMHRVNSALKTAMFTATLFTIFGFLVIMALPRYIIFLFNAKDAALLALGVPAMRITLCMLPIVGFQVVSSGYFQAIGRPRTSAMLMLTRQLIFLLPSVILLPRFLGINGIWMAIPVSDALAAILAGTMITLEVRRLQCNADISLPMGSLPDPPEEAVLLDQQLGA